MAASKLPPRADSGVFYVSASTLIDAPKERVWSIMLDFPSYEKWNPFVRNLKITDKAGKALAEQTPSSGQYFIIDPVHLPPTMGEPRWFEKYSAWMNIRTVDHDNFRIAWANIALPEFLLYAERWQMLSEVDGKTKYETIEVFSGLVAYVVMFFMYQKLVMGFNAQTDGLKRYAERTQ